MAQIFDLITQARTQLAGLQEAKQQADKALQEYPPFNGRTMLEMQFYEETKKKLQTQVEDLAAQIRAKQAEIKSLQGQAQTSLF